MTGRRVLLLDAPRLTPWRRSPHRFMDVARALAAHGFAVTLASTDAQQLADAPERVAAIHVAPPPLPLICASGRLSETRGLREAWAVAARFGGEAFDHVVAPLRGGLAFGLLMRRATGEGAGPEHVALWCDEPTRTRALDDDEAVGAGALMDDALERAGLRMADALIASDARALAGLESLGVTLPPVGLASLPLPLPHARPNTHAPGKADEIVLAGPLTRRGGALAFMDAIETLAEAGRMRGRRAMFVGPAAETPRGVGLTTLGLRAASWDCPLELCRTDDLREALGILQQHPGLIVLAAQDEDDRLRRALVAQGRRVVLADAGNAAALADAIAGGQVAPPSPPASEDWAALLASLPRAARPAASVQAAASVCIVARGRPRELQQAVASVRHDAPAGTEILIADNANAQALRSDAFEGAGANLRIERFDNALPPASALNRLGALARNDVLVFLDDDNVLRPGGLARLCRAIGMGMFDIVVSALELVDGNAATGPASGVHIFAGDPGMAGLFHNGFGDTSFAIRREAFARIGGFSDPGHHAPGWDWVTLAKARAAGLRIGVLIEPALRYARRIGPADANWRRHDREGVRRAVAQAYGEAIDAPFLARLAQSLALDAD